MTLAVIDASVAVKWFVPELRSEEADALAAEQPVLLAPLLIRMEVASALSKKARIGLVNVDHALEYVNLLPRYFARLIDHHDLVPAALQLSRDIDHSLFDCVYLETARLHEAVLVTDDVRLVAKARRHGLAGLTVPLADWRTALA